MRFRFEQPRSAARRVGLIELFGWGWDGVDGIDLIDGGR